MPAQPTPHHPSLDNDSYRPEPAIVLPPVPLPWRHVPVAYYRRQVNVAPALAMNFFMPIPVYLQLLTYLSPQKQLYVQCVLQPLVYLLYFIYNSMTLHIPFDDSWTHLIKLTLWCFTFLPGSSWIWQLFLFFLCSYVMPMWFLLTLLALKMILMVLYIIVVFKLLVSQYGLRTINRAYLPVALECVFLILSTMLFAFLLSSSHETPNIQNQQMLTSLEEQELFPSNGYIEAKQYYLTANTFPSHKENVPTERSELLPVQRDNEHVVNLTNFVDNDVAVEDQTSQSICRVFDTITNPYPVQEVRHYLERKYEVARFVWSDSSATGTLLQKIFFPDALLSMPSLINKVNWFKYLRAGVQLEVRINSTQFHFGQIMVSWVPYHRGDPADKDYYRSKSFYTCSWNNAMTISAAQSNSLTFNIPYTAPQSYMYLHGLGQPVIDPSCQIGTVFFHAMTPLLSSTPTATSDVDIVVYASFTDIDLAAYIPEVSSPMRGQSKTFMKEATVSSEARQKAQLNTNVGVPEALITARDVISTVVGSAKEILSLGQDVAPLLPLLLDKPLNEQLTQPVIVSVGQDVPNGDGTDSSTKLSLQREAILSAKTGFLTDATGFPLLPELMQRPALMDIFTWTSVQAVGSNVSWVADPMICKFAPDGTNYIFHPTPLSYFCSPFRFWRGSIKFKFQFRTSGFTTARFRVWHIPAGIDVADLEAESGDVVTALLDVRGDTDFDFNVPYLKPTFWSRNAGYRTAANAVDDMRIVVSLVTTPASSDVSDDSPIYMIVWVAAGEDFQVNQLVRPTEAGLRIDGISALMAYNTTPAAGPSGVMRGQSINVAFNKPYESIIPGVSYTMERGLVAPESPCHLVECLKRYTGSTFIPTEDGLGVHADLNNPMSGKSVVDTLTPDSGQHLPPYFISPFVYWRGGLRRRLYAHITGNYGWLIANLQDTGNTLDNGALVVPGADDKGCASVEIPWYLPIPFRPLIGAINLPEEDVGSLYFYSSNNQALLYTLGLQAVAEDFQLGYLTGVSDVYRPIAPMKDSPKKKHPP